MPGILGDVMGSLPSAVGLGLALFNAGKLALLATRGSPGLSRYVLAVLVMAVAGFIQLLAALAPLLFMLV